MGWLSVVIRRWLLVWECVVVDWEYVFGEVVGCFGVEYDGYGCYFFYCVHVFDG